MPASPYDKTPRVAVPGWDNAAAQGWAHTTAMLAAHLAQRAAASSCSVLAVECYPGVDQKELLAELKRGLKLDHVLTTSEAFLDAEAVDHLVAGDLGGDDPIFGFMSRLNMADFLHPERLAAFKRGLKDLQGTVLVLGPAALLCCDADVVVYADMPRWEGQLRQRRGEVDNLGVSNVGLKASLQYKRSYFIDWRVADKLKKATMHKWDFLLDSTVAQDPRLVTGAALRAGLNKAVTEPFRVVPYFDTAPWGGQWMKEVCGLDKSRSNFGWCFDCVPEENSLLLDFGAVTVEIPSQNLVYWQPAKLLGDAVYGKFGAEFPIRFDFLDTMGGGSLSLQVHPLVSYAQETFGLHYTQDESYYILDAGPGAEVYAGVKNGVNPDAFWGALESAQQGGPAFPAAEYVNIWPAKKHDHFLIPAGTVHCSGSECMVLEISATPYIFTFKLWDWGRLGLDGKPRPINIEHGKKVVQMGRNTDWVKNNLINRIEPIAAGPGWREERTGLHEREFIETRRHWFSVPVEHDTRGNLNVLNLVEGGAAVVESPTGAFSPYTVHYAETFIVPAHVGKYTIRPLGQGECATIKAYVRSSAD